MFSDTSIHKSNPQDEEDSPPKQATCKVTRSNGKACKAFSMKGSEYCFTHNPDTKEARLVAWKAGGLANKFDPGIRMMRLEKPKDIIGLLSRTLLELRDGKVDPRIAGTLFMGANVLLRAHEVLTQEARLDRLEKALTNKPERESWSSDIASTA
jgi:hypothetical protein